MPSSSVTVCPPPTGNAILKIILDHGLSLSLAELVSWGLEAVDRPDAGTAEQIRGFFEGRLRFLLAEKGFTYDCLNAALAAGCDDPQDAFERVRAIEAMRGEADFLALAAASSALRIYLPRRMRPGKSRIRPG